MWTFEATFENQKTEEERTVPITVDSQMCNNTKQIYLVAMDIALLEEQQEDEKLVKLELISH